jgi:hypothetical protein
MPDELPRGYQPSKQLAPASTTEAVMKHATPLAQVLRFAPEDHALLRAVQAEAARLIRRTPDIELFEAVDRAIDRLVKRADPDSFAIGCTDAGLMCRLPYQDRAFALGLAVGALVSGSKGASCRS